MKDMNKYLNAVKRNSEMNVKATMNEANAAINQVNAAHHAVTTDDLRSASPISQEDFDAYMDELSIPHSPHPPSTSPSHTNFVRRSRPGVSNKRN
jgi:hypothetical protein